MATCKNTPGSWYCVCGRGFVMSEDSTECQGKKLKNKLLINIYQNFLNTGWYALAAIYIILSFLSNQCEIDFIKIKFVVFNKL